MHGTSQDASDELSTIDDGALALVSGGDAAFRAYVSRKKASITPSMPLGAYAGIRGGATGGPKLASQVIGRSADDGDNIAGFDAVNQFINTVAKRGKLPAEVMNF